MTMKNLKYFVMAMFPFSRAFHSLHAAATMTRTAAAAPAAALSQLLTAGRSTTSISMSFR